jgi:energy-converting hydrogenase Eha subunit B
MTTRSAAQRTNPVDPAQPARTGRRLLAVTWLVAAAVVAVPAFILAAVSDRPDDGTAGLILTVMVATGTALGVWLLASPSAWARRGSLLTSAGWLVGAALVYPTQDVAADAGWAAGGTLLAAAVTAVLALRAGP